MTLQVHQSVSNFVKLKVKQGRINIQVNKLVRKNHGHIKNSFSRVRLLKGNEDNSRLLLKTVPLKQMYYLHSDTIFV